MEDSDQSLQCFKMAPIFFLIICLFLFLVSSYRCIKISVQSALYRLDPDINKGHNVHMKYVSTFEMP